MEFPALWFVPITSCPVSRQGAALVAATLVVPLQILRVLAILRTALEFFQLCFAGCATLIHYFLPTVLVID